MHLVTENPYASSTILVGFIVTIITYVLLYGINLPAPVVVAVTGVISFLLGRWTRINKQEAKIIETMPQTEKDLIAPPKEA